MGARFDVIAVGELNPDLIFTGLDGYPELGKEKTANDLSMRLGSSTAIAAAQMAKLGLRVTMLSQVGRDSFAAFCKQELSRFGVDTSFLIEDESVQTGLTVSLSYPHDRMLVTYLGSITSLTEGHVPDDALSCSRHIHVSSYYLQHSLRPQLPILLKRAKNCGLTTSLDPGDDPKGSWGAGIWEALEYVDYFFPSENELLGIARERDIETAVKKLGQVVPVVTAKLGAKGATLFHDGMLERVNSFEVETVDTTGAGDSFDAGFIYGVLNGYPLSDCLRIANACGALCTTQPGGPAGFESASEVLRLAGKV